MAKNKGGRPHKEIDQNQFESLCAMLCTEQEICGFFETTDKTLTAWCKRTYGMGFSDIYKIKSQNGKISLRRMQMACAQKGSTSMLIWLGKQYLGQSDKVSAVNVEMLDDGFIDALKGTAKKDWENE